ncbi:MAG: ABC transporter substrate-binding protein [Polyangiaceae bacterium]|nr:ABC transporter substrate-binding protein [Polyangiaceae bacterium]
MTISSETTTMIRRQKRVAVLSLLPLLMTVGCSDETSSPTLPVALDPLRIAIFMPADRDPTVEGLPNFEWARENINAAGGVAGREIAFDYVDPDIMNVDGFLARAEALANDEEHVAVIGPPGSSGLSLVANYFLEANKPIVSTTSTSDDLLRAYGGRGPIWRTRESDIAQTELLVRFAQQNQAKRVTLLTSLDISGYTFFSWFGFFAQELGFPEDAVNIVTIDSMGPCENKVMEAMATMPEMLFVAPGSPPEMQCIVKSLPPQGMPRPRIVFADTGLDPYDMEEASLGAQGIEGFVGAGTEAFEAAYGERFPQSRLAPHGPSEYDAVLLLAYALELSGGVGWKPLISGMKKIADGTETNSNGWDAAGIKNNLAELRAGKRPKIQGATGVLEFEPGLYMDLASSTYAHFTIGPSGLEVDKRFSTDDPTFLTSSGAFVKPGLGPPNVDQSMWTPAKAKSDTWAVIAALSSGWSNYRHQSDALQQYRLLRENGIDDDHIVLILADDIATNPSNDKTGQVRNEPAGGDVYGGAVIDYGITITSADLQNILTGVVTSTTPKVISPTDSSNVYVYLAGHGGAEGMPLDAQTAEEGLSSQGDIFSPTRLRESFCSMQSNGQYRRALVVIESCFSGVFGDASADGIEYGCGMNAGEVPLEGVTLITAANAKEVSYAGAYDDEVPAWVNDGFSRQFVTNVSISLDRSLADVYADAYQSTAGSHPSIFNINNAGRLSLVPIGEMLTP